MTQLDPLYVAARQTLLDVLDALSPHNAAVVVVGAHAIYLRTGDAGIRVAPFTTDADVVLDPSVLAQRPELRQTLRSAGFEPRTAQPGVWSAKPAGDPDAIPVDIMVPAAVAAGRGRRSVELSGHDKMVARRAVGLEATLVDNDVMAIPAIGRDDTRVVMARVAGPTALLVAKLHKLNDRVVDGKADRIEAKDAGDVYRLMLTTDARIVRATLTKLLDDPRAADATRRALAYLRSLFGARGLPGVRLATEALASAVPRARIEAVTAGFVTDVLREAE